MVNHNHSTSESAELEVQNGIRAPVEVEKCICPVQTYVNRNTIASLIPNISDSLCSHLRGMPGSLPPI